MMRFIFVLVFSIFLVNSSSFAQTNYEGDGFCFDLPEKFEVFLELENESFDWEPPNITRIYKIYRMEAKQSGIPNLMIEIGERPALRSEINRTAVRLMGRSCVKSDSTYNLGNKPLYSFITCSDWGQTKEAKTLTIVSAHYRHENDQALHNDMINSIRRCRGVDFPEALKSQAQ